MTPDSRPSRTSSSSETWAGTGRPEYDRDSTLTSSDFERPVRLSGDERAELFARRRDEAPDHARELMDPKRLNWVTVEFIWV